MSVYFLRKNSECASKISRTIFTDPSGLLRGFFGSSSRVLEGSSKRLREFSKKPRRMCGYGTPFVADAIGDREAPQGDGSCLRKEASLTASGYAENKTIDEHPEGERPLLRRGDMSP